MAKGVGASSAPKVAVAKDALQRALHPHPAAALVLVLVSAAGLAWCFLLGGEGHPLSYALYALSAYALAVCVVAAVPGLRVAYGRIMGNAHVARVAEDEALRAGAAGVWAVLFDVAYAAFTLATGFAYNSGWAIAVALYHVAIAGIGFVLAFGLVRAGRSDDSAQRTARELSVARTCGVLLAVLALALSGVMFQMVAGRQAWVYDIIVVIASATFTFVNLGFAIKGAVQVRKVQRPALVASRATTLSKTLVQLFFLETTMIAVFGVESGETFRFAMEAATGAAVFLLVVTIAVMLIRYATRRLSALA